MLNNYIIKTSEMFAMPLPGWHNSALKSATCLLPAEPNSPIDWGEFSEAGFSADVTREWDCDAV